MNNQPQPIQDSQSSSPEASASMTFQQSMTRLQQIVNELSNPNLELEKAMQLFEEGLTLSKNCENQLSAFEKQMNTLMHANGMGGTQ